MKKWVLPLIVCWMAAGVCLAQEGALPARLRGVDGECKALTPDAAAPLAKWGANVVRITIAAPDKPFDADESAPLAPYEKDLSKLRDFLPGAAQQGIKVIVAFEFSASPAQTETLWSKSDEGQKLRAHLVAFWKAFAREFKENSSIIGYDLLSKPNDTTPGGLLWSNELLPAMASAVREENKSVWLFVEPPSWGRPYGFVKFPLLSDDRVVYGFNMFAPFNYLYQGISSKSTRGKFTYPGKLIAVDYDPVEKLWNKDALVDYLKPAIDFGKTNHVRMAVLSFGVARWAPGRETWTADVLDLFEQNGWDWMYSTTIGYNGMNPTFGPDDPDALTAEPGSEVTPQFKLMLDLWKKNKL